MPPELTQKLAIRRSRRTITGCITCRTRHVKCDERKPTCKNCEAVGRECHGYVSGRLSRQTPYRNLDIRRPLTVPVRPQAILVPRGVSSTVFQTTQEWSNYEFFDYWINVKVCEAFGSRLWDLLVLQASQTEPAIKHLVMAMSTLLRQHHDYQTFSLKGQYGATAIAHYNHAISHARVLLAAANDRQQINVGLIACLLFVCFDNLVGNYSMARNHLQSGGKILLERHRSRRAQLSKETTNRLLREDRAPPTHHDDCEPIIENTFERLDFQDVARLSSITAPPQMIIQMLNEFMPAQPPAKFKYLHEARDRLLDLTISVHRLADCVLGVRANEPLTVDHQLHIDFEIKRLHYLFCLDRWSKAFELLPEAQRVSPNVTMSSAQDRITAIPVYLLRMYYTEATLTAKCCMRADETAWDEHMPLFETIVDIAKILLDPKDGEQITDLSRSQNTKGTFKHGMSFEFGPIFPLFTAALKCRQPDLRREAIEVLKNSDRREGTFSSKCAGVVADMVMQFEEKGCHVRDARDIPEKARILLSWNSAWGVVDDGSGVWFLRYNKADQLQWFPTGFQLTQIFAV